ncbi:MAG: sulfate/thiosulfate ABC transporter permease CysW, partial [Mesorhizobium sp.]
MADPEIKSYEPHHESLSAAVTESRQVKAVLMAIAFAFLAV